MKKVHKFKLLSKIILSSLLIFSFLLPPVMAESEASLEEYFVAFLNDYMANPEVAALYEGAAITIVKDGEVVVEQGFGFADVGNEVAVDADETVFRIASVTKSLTAVAVMQLVEQGLIDLDADIQTYLGDIAFDNPFDQPVTMKHLLSHTSGFEIRDPDAADFSGDFERVVEIEDFVRAQMPPVVREPGTSYMYGNFDSLLQGLIVQNVSGQPFEAYMKEHIFAPLEMNSSGFLLEGILKDNLATGYDPAGEAMDVYAVTPTVMPHGGMLTTAADMGKFMVAFLDDIESGTENLLNQSSAEQMVAYRVASHSLLPNTTYGFESTFRIPGVGSSDEIITKAGDLMGFSSYVWFVPEENLGVFVTYNNNGPLREALFMDFMSTFFPQYFSPAELGEYAPSEDLNRFEGLYVDLRLPSIINAIKAGGEGELIISNAFLGAQSIYQLDELLFGDANGMLFSFVENEDGSIAYLDEPYLNPLGYASKAPSAAGFIDVDVEHPFSEYIFALQSYGLYPNDAAESFEPERQVTRAEYIQNVLFISGLKGSDNPVVFADAVDHPAAAEIQFAYEMGLIVGDGEGHFAPDRAITRQEAAMIVWRSYSALYPPNHFDFIELGGETDEWALSAVKMMLGLGLYGPEVQVDAQGALDFLSKQPMLRQEEAAHQYLLLTQPTLNVPGGEAVEEMGEEAGEDAGEDANGDDAAEEAEADGADGAEADGAGEEVTEEATDEVADEAE